MNAIRIFLIVIFFTPIFIFGQESKYSKDTIYIKYENKKGAINWNAKFERAYEKMNGIFFNVENEKGNLALFYDIKKKSDTLCISYLKDYNFLNMKEIDKKEKEYYKKRFGGNPWIKNKNAVFHTFLVEVISKEEFVIYPVVWRNEGG